MADYYPLIARAVEGLADKSPAVRRAVYERARNALVTQLQSLQPPVAPADIERERAALDLAIGSVEALYVLPTPQTAVEAQLPPEPSQTLLGPIDSSDNGSHQAVVEQEDPSAVVDDDADDIAPEVAVEAQEVADEAQEAAPAVAERPRIGSKRHSSGQANRIRAVILVVSVLAVVIGIASWKLYDREQQAMMQAAEQQANEPAESAQSETGKFTDRLGGGMMQETPAQTNGTEAASTVAVQKAVLLETDPSTAQLPPSSQKVIASAGLTKWSLEQKEAGPGLPLETVIHGEVEFPQVGFKLDFQMRKDRAGSAVSHLITLTFAHAAGDADHDVINVSKLQMKDDPADVGGSALSVSPIPIAANVFMLGLANIPSQVEYNLQLLQSKNWIVVEFMFPDGRLGAIGMEKGSTGFQVVSDAIRAWQ